MSDPIIITDKDELKKAINKDDYTSQKLFGDNTPDKQCIDPWHIKIDTTGVDCDKEKATKSAPEEVIKQLPKQDNISTDVQNLKGILTDIAAGDPEAFKRPEFQCLNFDAIYAAIDWLIKTDQLSDLAKADLAENGWRLNFRARPPTPEEFLTEKYIGDQANTLYAPVRKSFIDAMDPLSPTRTVVLSPHIGWGKSLLAILINLYESVHFALMWHPYKFFGQSAATIYTQTFCAWSLKKGSELLLAPMSWQNWR
jgi:hypothetical protein